MANKIGLITKYSTEAFDLVYKQESVSSLLDANPKWVKFVGAKTVKIGKLQNGGLQDYYRNNTGDGRVPVAPNGTTFAGSAPFGYQRANVALLWEEFTMKCDRAACFQIESFDNEESGGELVGSVVSEVSRVTIIPEVDAYTMSTIASYCTTELGNLVTGTFTGSDAKPIAALNTMFTYFANNEVPTKDQIVFVSPDFMNSLRNTTEVTKFLGQTDYENKDIKFEITKYQGRTLVEVSPQRLRTNIVLFGQEGYSWGAGSKAINFLGVSKEAVNHVVKYEKVKVLDGDLALVQGFDGYAVYARIYHDVFVADNKRVGIYCNVEATASAAPAAKLDILVKDGKIASITTIPGDKLYFVGTSTDSGTKNVGDTLTNFTAVSVGDKVTATTTFYAVDSNKKIVAKQAITVA